MSSLPSAHVDRFVLDRLPPADQMPEILFGAERPEYPEMLNAGSVLLDDALAQGWGERPLLHTPEGVWTYAAIGAMANRVAHVLAAEVGLEPGGRVLLRGANTPMLVAIWLGVLKAGGIAVTTMPMLRSRELAGMLTHAAVDIALCEVGLEADLNAAIAAGDAKIPLLTYSRRGDGTGSLDIAAAKEFDQFTAVATRGDDPALLSFTSGTTGVPKATIHFHRDILAIADSFPRWILQANADDRFLCSAPMAFTFGLGPHLIFPMRVGASSILLPSAIPEALRQAIPVYQPTILMTAPTAYAALLRNGELPPLGPLRHCVSAGEHLPLAVFQEWQAATGMELIDGIGATEMLHIFVASPPGAIRPGATGKPVPGYIARIVRDDMTTADVGEVGRLAVRGPTGCKYLGDERQKVYVVDGWNLTGDKFYQDQDGYFWCQGRSDDMIVSSGYNISGAEVEEALIGHHAVRECAVVGSPDRDRGIVVKAFVCLVPGVEGTDALVKELQDFVKQAIAPYKYPRRIEFLEALPRNESGKVQRFVLRDREQARAT